MSAKAPAEKMNVPFVDLKAQYRAIKPEIDAAMERVIANTSFILGPEVKAFEEAFAEFTGFKHAIGVGNGTDAINVALRACGLAPGDEVVAPAHTFVASTEAITQAGGKVRLADISDTTCCMTKETLEAACTPATKFALPVPVYGNPAGLDAIVDFAKGRGIRVVVDAAQAHGARLDGKRLGEIADVATYSFYPGKNLGAYGDAGAVVTNDDEIARNARMWRNHGREGKFDHSFEGINSRMDGMQGAILAAKLKHLQSWCDNRRRVAGWYREALAGLDGLRLPEETPGAEHVYHLYVVRHAERDRLRDPLKERGVASGIHYPQPVHLTTAYAGLGHARGSFPVAEEVCDTCLSLPMYPEMVEAQVAHVAAALREVL